MAQYVCDASNQPSSFSERAQRYRASMAMERVAWEPMPNVSYYVPRRYNWHVMGLRDPKRWDEFIGTLSYHWVASFCDSPVKMLQFAEREVVLVTLTDLAALSLFEIRCIDDVTDFLKPSGPEVLFEDVVDDLMVFRDEDDAFRRREILRLQKCVLRKHIYGDP